MELEMGFAQRKKLEEDRTKEDNLHSQMLTVL
jgi:hypothetical protein